MLRYENIKSLIHSFRNEKSTVINLLKILICFLLFNVRKKAAANSFNENKINFVLISIVLFGSQENNMDTFCFSFPNTAFVIFFVTYKCT